MKQGLNCVKAETLLNELLCDPKNLLVSHESYFYRNYKEDLISFDEHDNTVKTSRNGLLGVLPEGLLFGQNVFDGLSENEFKEASEKLNEQRETAAMFFMPLDSEFFTLSMLLESTLNDIINSEVPDILENLFDVNLNDVDNEYSRKIVPMLLFSSKIRGNCTLISDLLSDVFCCKVSYNKRQNQNEDGTVANMEHVFVVNKENLSASEYLRFTDEIKLVFDLIADWWMPAGMDVKYFVKDYKQTLMFRPEKPLALFYNTKL